MKYGLTKYEDPTRRLRARVMFLACTTALFAALALLAAYKADYWHLNALQWEYKALSGGGGDGL